MASSFLDPEAVQSHTAQTFRFFRSACTRETPRKEAGGGLVDLHHSFEQLTQTFWVGHQLHGVSSLTMALLAASPNPLHLTKVGTER